MLLGVEYSTQSCFQSGLLLLLLRTSKYNRDNNIMILLLFVRKSEDQFSDCHMVN